MVIFLTIIATIGFFGLSYLFGREIDMHYENSFLGVIFSTLMGIVFTVATLTILAGVAIIIHVLLGKLVF